MVDSVTMSQSHWSRADHSTLIKAQLSTIHVPAERRALDETEAIRTCVQPAENVRS